ncbi:MAG: AlpA family phage regulatory protein [Candidatus Sedimenticola sp. (ex Thyasira tokunagai)]
MKKVLRLKEVEELTGYKRSSLYAMMANERFPRNYMIGPNRVVWDEEEVNKWLEDRISKAKEVA